MISKDKTNILLTLPIDLKEKLTDDSKADHRSLNNYILTVLLKRDK